MSTSTTERRRDGVVDLRGEPPATPPAVHDAVTPPAPQPVPTPSPPRPDRPWARVLGSALSLAAVGLLAFVGSVGLVSQVEHARSQRIAYADLRLSLATVTAPTGQTDVEGALLDLGTPIGFITSPALGLDREVVLEGTTGAVLRGGPGHRRSSVMPGQPGVSTLYGRSWGFGGPFGGVTDLVPGDELLVTTGQGEHLYRVMGLRREGDPIPAPPDAAAGEGRLTLVTAERGSVPLVPEGLVYVDAELVSTPVQAPGRVIGTSALSSSEEALAGDRSAWIDVFLFLQGVAAAALAATWAARRWTPSQAWLAAFPVVGLFVLLAAREAVRLLPNLL